MEEAAASESTHPQATTSPPAAGVAAVNPAEWLRGLEEVHHLSEAARAVLMDRHTRPKDAVPLLEQAWQVLLEVQQAVAQQRLPQQPPPSLSVLLESVPVMKLPRGWEDRIRQLSRHDLHPARTPLLQTAYWAQRSAQQLRKQVWSVHGGRPPRVTWRRVAWVLGSLMLVGGVTFAAVWEPPVAQTGWLASYFPTMDLTGTPIIRRDVELNMFWNEGSPMAGIPVNKWSARWDGCVTVRKKTRARFELGSDDGSRLSVDGTVLLDSWGSHGMEWRSGETELAKGVHHLRVEFMDDQGQAAAVLKMGLGGRAPAALAPGDILYPGGNPAREDLCSRLR